jgi:hypothetical protein
MFQNPAIDVAIGLILMYLMLSLFCTVINEFLATKLKLRSKSLASALERLLDNQTLRDTFYRHGLIVTNKHAAATGPQSTISGVDRIARATASAARNLVSRPPAAHPAPQAAPPAQPVAPPAAGAAPVASVSAPASHKDHPSYLSSRNVALALIGSLAPDKPLPGFKDIENAVQNLPPSHIRDALLSSLTEAGGELDKLRTSIAAWFDDSMERLSGAYKRQQKWILMLIGLVVAIAFNADSFNVATSLWHDPDRRAAVIEMATTVAQGSDAEAPESVDQAKLQNTIKETENTLRSLPIGWNSPQKQVTPGSSGTKLLTAILVKILGWLLTAAALTLGAPFWFDLLQKFVNIRGAGGKPRREDQKAAA